MRNVKRLRIAPADAASRRTSATVGAAALAVVFCLNMTAASAQIPTAIPTPILPSPNAHDALYSAANLEVRSADVDAALGTPAGTRPSPVDLHADNTHDFTLGEKEALIAENAPALAALRQAIRLPFWNPPVRSASALMPELAKYRALSRLLALDAQVKEARGDYAGAASSSLDAIEIGIEVPRGGVLLADLVGIACEATGERSLWRSVNQLDAAGAAAGARRLEALTARRFPYADTVQEEKWTGQAVILNALLDRSTLGDNTASEALGNALQAKSKQEIFNDYTAIMDAAMAQARLPYSTAYPAIGVSGDAFSEAVIPTFKPARFKDFTARMQSSLLTATLALRSYYVKNHLYPRSLDNLVAFGILTRVPQDPFAAALDTPLRYRRLSNDTYLLYSIGPDGIDDGGKPIAGDQFAPQQDDKGDWVVGTDTGTPGN